jgi:HK97 family phage portal protein
MALFEDMLNRFRRKPAMDLKQAGAMVGYFGVGSTTTKMFQYEDLAREGYLRNAIVYRCVNEISKGASSVPFVLKSGDDALESHPVISLLDRPNPQQSYSEFFTALYGYLLLSGNAYILKVAGARGVPKELHLLRPDRIEIKGKGGSVFPEIYEYRVNGSLKASYEVDQDTGFSELKQVKLWHPMDDYYGCSPLTAAAMEVDQHNSATKHNINLLENGARPSGAVVFKPQDDAGYQMQLSDSQRQQLLTDLNTRFTGSKNAGRPMLLEGDFDWKEMGLSPKDMDFLNLKHMSATDIAMCFGVPSQLVGVPDAQTYSNVAEARLALYEETIIPYLRKVESDLNEWLVPQFNEDFKFEYDIDKIPALSERRRLIYENVIGAVDKGIMTRNEARELVGLNPMEGADDLLVPANLFPLNEGPPPEPERVDDEDDIAQYEEEEEEEEENITNFPSAGQNKTISLKNSNFPQFDYKFAEVMAKDESKAGKLLWKKGDEASNHAYSQWSKARQGSQASEVREWIKRREERCVKHNGGLTSNGIALEEVMDLVKWGVINTGLGEKGMKKTILEAAQKLEIKKWGIVKS